MVRMKSSLLSQNSSGLSPGTLRLSSRTCCSLAKKEKELDVAREERKRGSRMVVAFMIDVERLLRVGRRMEIFLVIDIS